jgi:hypothetical protein
MLSDDAEALGGETGSLGAPGGKQTAELARAWLIESRSERGYRSVDRTERIRIAQAFAAP